MRHSSLRLWTSDVGRREFSRIEIDCRARIRIGNRQYAGYLHNISQGGAKLRTITPIHRVGGVVLRLPDLSPLHCDLRWRDSHNAGVMFGRQLSEADLLRWAEARLAVIDLPGASTPSRKAREMSRAANVAFGSKAYISY
jgi:hypothetical protein